jgi:hypothetical protein
MTNDLLQRIKKKKNLKIIISHLGILGEKPTDFLYTFKGTRNVYFDTLLANQDTVMRFIDKIGYGSRFDWDKSIHTP